MCSRALPCARLGVQGPCPLLPLLGLTARQLSCVPGVRFPRGARGVTGEQRWKDRTGGQVQGQTEMPAGRGLLCNIHPVDKA